MTKSNGLLEITIKELSPPGVTTRSDGGIKVIGTL